MFQKELQLVQWVSMTTCKICTNVFLCCDNEHELNWFIQVYVLRIPKACSNSILLCCTWIFKNTSIITSGQTSSCKGRGLSVFIVDSRRHVEVSTIQIIVINGANKIIIY